MLLWLLETAWLDLSSEGSCTPGSAVCMCVCVWRVVGIPTWSLIDKMTVLGRPKDDLEVAVPGVRGYEGRKGAC